MLNAAGRKFVIRKLWLCCFSLVFSTLSIAHADTSSDNANSFRAVGTDFSDSLANATLQLDAGRPTLAQWWLRRAYEHAPDQSSRQDIRALYRDVQRRNPFSLSLNFSFSPSSNVNNGNDNDIVWLGGLPFQIDIRERSYSGYRAELSVLAAYRLSESSSHRSDIMIDAFHRRVWLLDEDRLADEVDVKGSDFNFTSVSVGTRTLFNTWDGFTPAEVRWSVGQTWYGGEDLSYWGELSANQGFILSQNTLLRGAASLRRISRQDTSMNNSMRRILSFGFLHEFRSGNFSSIDLIYEKTSSESAAVDSDSVAVAAGIQISDIGNVRPSLKLTFESRYFDQWQASDGHRIDNSILASASMDLVNFDFYGFSPQVILGYRSTNSNVSIYSKNEGTIGLAIKSSF